MSRRILVVEDQEDNRRILRDLLTSGGFVLIEATTGEEGVLLAHAHEDARIRLATDATPRDRDDWNRLQWG
jgi:CheY-like chemotaxis protein